LVEKWLEREEYWIDKDSLRAFSERLAVGLYTKSQERGAERIPYKELVPLAKEWNISLYDWQIRGRSLLNRDAEGNYKFAHRSIMEYLFVIRLLKGDTNCYNISLTDQMKQFFVEIASVSSPDIHYVRDLITKVGIAVGAFDETTKTDYLLDTLLDDLIELLGECYILENKTVLVKLIFDETFRELVSSKAFRGLINDDTFRTLIHDDMFKELISSDAFRELITDNAFAALINDTEFRLAVRDDRVRWSVNDITFRAKGDNRLRELLISNAFRVLINNNTFRRLIRNDEFRRLICNFSFKAIINNHRYKALIDDNTFRRLMNDNTFARLIDNDTFVNLIRTVNKYNNTIRKFIAKFGTDQLYGLYKLNKSSLQLQIEPSSPDLTCFILRIKPGFVLPIV
jgi:hypothetical protein